MRIAESILSSKAGCMMEMSTIYILDNHTRNIGLKLTQQTEMIAVLKAHKNGLVNHCPVRDWPDMDNVWYEYFTGTHKLFIMINYSTSYTHPAQGCCRQMMYKYLWNLNGILMCDLHNI